MVTVDSSWMDDVIDGKDPSGSDGTSNTSKEPLTEPVTPGDGSSIKAVVDSFLDQKHLFTPLDLRNYINTALQMEGSSLLATRSHAQDLAESWDGYAENLRSGYIPEDSAPMSAEEAEAKRESSLADYEMGYVEGRRLLSSAVAELQAAHEVVLTPETWSILSDLDHDGWVSECLGYDVQTAKLAAIERAERTAFEASTSVVDFSREAHDRHADEGSSQRVEPVTVFLPDALPDKQVNHRQPPASGEPVRVGAVMNAPDFTAGWSQASRDKLAVARMEYETKKAEEAGPELG
ncbi:hypothetical protein ANMWB30_23110 [Arthrobacter sp. MWB30]|nr:hypothetical protein ANMWB30_23110 [Arthrobacter sp. MWB30]